MWELFIERFVIWTGVVIVGLFFIAFCHLAAYFINKWRGFGPK